MRFQIKLAIGFLLTLGIFSVLSVYTYRTSQQQIESSRWVTRTNEVLFSSQGLLTAVLDAETGSRGFVLTGDEKFLEPYLSATDSIKSRLAELHRLTADNPLQQAKIKILADAIDEKIKWSEKIVTTRQTGFEEARNLVISSTGYHLMEEVRRRLSDFQAEEKRLLAIRAGESENQIRFFNKSFIITLLIVVIILVVMYALVFVNLKKRKLAEAALAQLNKSLEQKVKERTTQLSQLLNEIKRSEEMLQETGALAKVGGWEINPGNMSMQWTDEVYRIHELERGQMPALEDGINFYAPPARPIIQDALNKAITTGEGWNLELPFITAKGKNIWVKALGKTEMNGGKVTRLFGVFQDITELKKAEESLAASENHLRTIILAEPECVKLLGINCELEDMNPAGLAMIEADDLAQVKGTSILPIINEPYRQAFDALTRNAFAGNSGEMEFEITGLKGTHRWMGTHIVPLKNAEGAIISALGVTRDITARKKAEDDIRKLNEGLEQTVMERTGELIVANKELALQNKEKEKRAAELIIANKNLKNTLKDITDYKFALDESSIVAITDQKGIIKFANDNFCKISKYSREELLGQDHRIINSGFHPKEFIHDLWATITNGEVWKGELRNKAKDGTIYWVDTTIVPFLNEQGKPYQYVAIRADITERKKAEEQLLSLIKELEAFTYSVSHDLRAPLRSIDGYARILEEDYGGKLDDDGKRVIATITCNAVRMGGLIDDLLEFSRMGRKELSQSNIDMDTLVQGVIHELTEARKERLPDIHVLPLGHSSGDRGMLYRVWTNLISNAVKYSSKKESPKIEIGSSLEDGQACYYVRDNGAGFDMQYADKLFGVFQRLHKQNEFEGTGVGLALVKRIIQRHNGRVWAEGKLNEGATFYFSLPQTKPTDL